MTDRRYAALACPACGASPEPDRESCPGCGRVLRGPSGGLDLLADDLRAEAYQFAAEYSDLRLREKWVERQRASRERAVADASRALQETSGTRPLVLDVGSGGGWAAAVLAHADVIAIDLVEAGPGPALSVRGDMRHLPVRDRTADGVLFAASMHYAPIAEVVTEAARVLRTGGLLIAVDSPVYLRAGEAARAAERSRDYYSAAGHPDLAGHYHPIDAAQLRSALIAAGFRLERMQVRSRWRLRTGPASLVLATRLR